MNEEYAQHCGYNWSSIIERMENSFASRINTFILFPLVPMSLISNSLLLYVLIKTGHIRKRSCFLATNLAIIDIFCTISIGLFEIYFDATRKHFGGLLGCKMTASAYTLYFSGTTLFMMFSAIERYYNAILQNDPIKDWKFKVLIAAIYLYLVFLQVLTMYGTYYQDEVCNYSIYFFRLIEEGTKPFHLVTSFFIPGIVLGVIFLKIGLFLREDAKKYAVPQNTLSSVERLRRHTTSLNNTSGTLSSRNRIFYMLALSVSCFYGCQLLWVVITTWKLIAEKTLVCMFPSDHELNIVLTILAYPLVIVNCAINPNIYLILSRKFRMELDVILEKVKKRCCFFSTQNQVTNHNAGYMYNNGSRVSLPAKALTNCPNKNSPYARQISQV